MAVEGFRELPRSRGAGEGSERTLPILPHQLRFLPLFSKNKVSVVKKLFTWAPTPAPKRQKTSQLSHRVGYEHHDDKFRWIVPVNTTRVVMWTERGYRVMFGRRWV